MTVGRPPGRADPKAMRMGKASVDPIQVATAECSKNELYDRFRDAEANERQDLLYTLSAMGQYDRLGAVLRKDLGPARPWSGTAYFLLRDRRYDLLEKLGDSLNEHWRDDPSYLNWSGVPVEVWRTCRPDPEIWIGSLGDATAYRDEVEWPFIEADRFDILEDDVVYSINEGSGVMEAGLFLHGGGPNTLARVLDHPDYDDADEVMDAVMKKYKRDCEYTQLSRRALRIVLRRLDQSVVNDYARRMDQLTKRSSFPALKRGVVTAYEQASIEWPRQLIQRIVSNNDWWTGLGADGKQQLKKHLQDQPLGRTEKDRIRESDNPPFPLRFSESVVRTLKNHSAMPLPVLGGVSGDHEHTPFFRAFQYARQTWAPKNPSLNGEPKRSAERAVVQGLSKLGELTADEIAQIYQSFASYPQGIRMKRRVVDELIGNRLFPSMEQLGSVLDDAPDPVRDEVVLKLPGRVLKALEQSGSSWRKLMSTKLRTQ